MDFNSLETGEAFDRCCDCGCDLSDDYVSYMVQKSYVGEECIFEYAICNDCREKVSEEFSEKSREAMFDFFHDRADIDEKMMRLGPEASIDEHIQTCLTCSSTREEVSSYSYAGLFLGTILLPGPFPVMICGKCEEELTECLSQETRDAWNRFLEENFPGPPADVLDKPRTGKPILL
ncbi:hypothetical protein SAMN02745181_2029 [Rubritalea squalenifaciens DSM 18772]|uniref:Uncharacterized protein n=1 Tax=Rubritalea squalenifaciens DSM 18772 TaxID=1123071 RepID=A0A1M6J7A4_9BACT|nr:hypothetical protein [Rubritalea squalenifaciens]SHJ42535.1 hypothetical protein SAMN02745181_2029 [Rubritalea squalenifaciens DSM 18772]